MGVALLGLLGLALQQPGLPGGFSLLLAQLWLGWYGLDVLNHVLRRWLPQDQLHQLQSRLLRPGYLLLGAMVLISEVDSLQDLALAPMGQVFDVSVSAGKVFNALLVIYLVLVGCGPPAAGLAWLLQRAVRMSDGSRKATELMLRYAVVGLGLVSVAVHLGLNTTALIAVAGGLSVGLGFGIKEVFSNFVSGLWLLFEGSLRPGNIIALDGDFCEVRRLGLRATRLWRDRDNAELVIPNQTFFNSSTVEFSVGRTRFLTQIAICVDAGQPAGTILALLEEIAAAVPGVESHPPPKAYVQGVGDRGGDYVVKFWIHSPFANRRICSAVMAAAIERFRELGISLPFPRLIVERARTEPPGRGPG